MTVFDRHISFFPFSLKGKSVNVSRKQCVNSQNSP